MDHPEESLERHEASLRETARRWSTGELDWSAFVDAFRHVLSLPTDNATLDLDRHLRCGFPEVVFAEGKSEEDLLAIVTALYERHRSVLATRVSPSQAECLQAAWPDGRFHAVARTWRRQEGSCEASPVAGRVAVVTAGTTDRRVAEEAAETLRWMRVDVESIYDVGVAGPHRLAHHVPRLRTADAIVVAAGMEGALPSVVGGHVAVPVIAVPTSVGYGAAFGGLAALLGMLNSCAANVTVVNIDAGFKAGYVAGLIARRANRSGRTGTGTESSDD